MPAHPAGERVRALSQRQLRLGERVRQILAQSLKREHFGEPTLSLYSITVSEARLSNDLRRARIWITPLGQPEHAEELCAILNRAAPKIRQALGRGLRAKYTPALFFEPDTLLEETEALDHVFQKIRTSAK